MMFAAWDGAAQDRAGAESEGEAELTDEVGMPYVLICLYALFAVT